MSRIRVNDPQLSLWQSTVAEVIHSRLTEANGAEPTALDVAEHPMVLATNDFVSARYTRTDRVFTMAELDDPHVRNTHLSAHAFDLINARLEHRQEDEETLLGAWPYSDEDPKFVTECEAVYRAYQIYSRGKMLYNDWQIQGGGSLDYGVINWKLPNDAKVGIIGDWGTGMDDANELLLDMVRRHDLSAIIHLGDIYYSGTPNECANTFSKPMENMRTVEGTYIPVFTLPGNHDYYAWGYGFYPMLETLNASMPDAKQDASYFCLQTEDGGWQFLGMDTGFFESNPTNQLNPFYSGPWLQPSEVIWHYNRLNTFGGATILLSHHQLFTANAKINGATSSQSEYPNLNPYLLQYFQRYFNSSIAGWYWGHEHNFVLYNGLYGLDAPRLLGSSAFEEMEKEDPYKIKYPEVSYVDNGAHQLSPNAEGYYSHSYGVIDFSKRASPKDGVQVSYYEFPSWYKTKPANPQSTLLYSESLVAPRDAKEPPVNFGDSIQLSINGGSRFISSKYGKVEYYPTVGLKPQVMKVKSATGSSGPITNGAQILVETTETSVGAYNRLGAFATKALYYWKAGNYASNVTWTIVKVGGDGDSAIRYGDSFALYNVKYSGQAIYPTGNGYLSTTKVSPPTTFVCKKP